MTRDRIDWHAVDEVHVHRAGCPSCGSEQKVRLRTYDNLDGSNTTRVICASCSEPWLLISEPPETGETDSDEW